MSATDYFVTPRDIGRGVQRMRLEHAIGAVLGFATAILVYKFTGLGLEAALFAAMLIALMVWRSDPRWLFGAAIGSFGAIIVVSTMWREVEIFEKPLSERMAVWSFYFLVIGVMLLIVESYWPKDGTFNALQQRAPSAGKDRYRNLPQHIKTKLKHQREERAAIEAATAKSKSATQNQGFKHPLFSNSQQPLSDTSKQVDKTSKDLQRRNAAPAQKPFQYIQQTPPKLRPQSMPRTLPLPGTSSGTTSNQPKHTAPRIYGSQTAGSSIKAPSAAEVNVAASASPPTKQPLAVRKQPALLDLRTAQRTAPKSKTSIAVAVKSDSPLPSKRRKLVQL